MVAALYPIDTVKTRLQMATTGGGVRALFKGGGGKALYAGMPPQPWPPRIPKLFRMNMDDTTKVSAAEDDNLCCRFMGEFGGRGALHCCFHGCI